MRTSVEVLFVIIITVFTDCISALKVDKDSPVTEAVEAENTGSSDQAPPKSKASKKKVFILNITCIVCMRSSVHS